MEPEPMPRDGAVANKTNPTTTDLEKKIVVTF